MTYTPQNSGTSEPESQKILIIAIIAIIVIAAVVGVAAIWIMLNIGNGSTATETQSFSDSITTDDMYLEVDNFNGNIIVTTWDSNEYDIDIEIIAKDSLLKKAEAYLEDVDVYFDDSVSQGKQRIILEIDAPVASRTYLTINVDAVLPAGATIDIDLKSSNGNIQLNDIIGGELVVQTSNGGIDLNNVYADIIEGQTSNGNIDCNFPCTISGEYDLITSNGGVDIDVSSSSEVGYDIAIITSNGNADIYLSDLIYSVNEDTHKEAVSEGFSSKSVQISIDAITSNGNISIRT